MKIGKLEIDLNELAEFIVEAKKAGYGGGGKYRRLKDGSKRLVFQKGNFFYEDNYAGSYQAPGNEIVRWKKEDGQRIWQMSYSGGMFPKYWEDKELSKKTFGFLKEALLQINSKYPFRGPVGYENKQGDFLYRNKVDGDIKRFKGTEEIYFKKFDNLIFSQDYIGGLII